MTAGQGAFAPLGAHNYRLYFTAAVFTTTGTWMQRVATDWLVLQLTGSIALVGLSVSLQFAPALLLGPWAGLISDRLPRRKLLIVTQSVVTLVSASLATVVLLGVVQPWQVLTAALVSGTVLAIDAPARGAFISEMVGTERLGQAISLNSSVFHLGGLVGPSISGALIALLGSGLSIAVNALATLGAAVALAVMRPQELVPAPRVAPARGQIREAVRYAAGKPTILWPITLLASISFFGMNLPVLLTTAAADTHGTGAAGYGLYSSLAALGAFLGAVLSARRRVLRLPGIVLLAAGFGCLLIAAGLLPWYAGFLAALVGLGLARVSFATAAQSLTQLSCPDQLRGRVISFYMMVLLGGQALGAVVLGWVCERWGSGTGFVVAGSGPVVVALVVWLRAVRRRRPRAIDSA